MTDYSRLPEHMQEPARKYVEEGRHPGDFLTAVLANNLVEAFGRADSKNQDHMQDWVIWLYNECPGGAWGSEKRIKEWVAQRGLKGIEQ